MHYQRWRKHSTPADLRPSVEDRFWSKVDKAGPLPRWAPFLGPCWLWTASTAAGGYGQFKAVAEVGGSMTKAHRFAYELVVGPIPAGLHIDHLCRVRRCVNPAHLEPVTHAENVRRGFAAPILGALNGAKTHCIHGHEFTEANTYHRPTGGRACKTCKEQRRRPAASVC